MASPVKSKRRRKALRQLGAPLPPGVYTGTATVKGGVLGFKVEGWFVPIIHGVKK
jgi:hypothetical protein